MDSQEVTSERSRKRSQAKASSYLERLTKWKRRKALLFVPWAKCNEDHWINYNLLQNVNLIQAYKLDANTVQKLERPHGIEINWKGIDLGAPPRPLDLIGDDVLGVVLEFQEECIGYEWFSWKISISVLYIFS